MQVSAVTFHYYARTVAFDNVYPISSLHRWFICIHLSYSYLTSLKSLFLFPFNTCLLLNKHREAVYSLRLHSDCDRPTIIFRTAFLYLHIFRYSIHGTPGARRALQSNMNKESYFLNPILSLSSHFLSAAFSSNKFSKASYIWFS